MKIVFGTTNERKVEDFQKVVQLLGYKIEVLTLSQIGWNLGEIEETGSTLEENSNIKAEAIYQFLKKKNLNIPVFTDDGGLFVEALEGRPGVYTARYGDTELKKDPTLPKYVGVEKLLKEMEQETNRTAYYRSVVTCICPDGTQFQEKGETKGEIARKMEEPFTKPYFYTVFSYQGKNFRELSLEELKTTYRFQAIEKALRKCLEHEGFYED